MLPSLTTDRERYQACIGQQFLVTAQGEISRPLTLESVETTIDTEHQLCFLLVFHSADLSLPPGLHHISHPLLGEFGLTLELVRRRKSGMRYEAVFNLLREPAADFSQPQG